MSDNRQPEPPRRGSQRYPSNAHGDKEVARQEPKKAIVGKATLRKPMSDRIRESIVGDDVNTIGSYLLFDVVIPAVKDLIVETGKETIERMFFPSGQGPRSRTRGSFTSASGSFTRAPYRSGARRDHDVPFEREERRRLPDSARNHHRFDDIILETRGDAEVILQKMRDQVKEFGAVSVAEVLDEIGYGGDDNYLLRDWGWKDLTDIGYRRIASDQYMLVLPDTVRLS